MFNEEYLDFFKELAQFNKKEWFDENRKRYEKSVKIPFKKFVTELIQEIQKIDPEVEIEAKDAVFRINRDIRFSKDKTPYKIQMSAILSPGGKKNKEVPGLYIEASPENFKIYGGVHQLGKDNLSELRNYIATRNKEFETLISNPNFKSTFGEILGEKSKRIPTELKEVAAKHPLIFNKAFYFVNSLPAETILRSDLIPFIVEQYKIALPFNQFVRKAIHY
jgi:uncharacterized protein (TIGR02453 family)